MTIILAVSGFGGFAVLVTAAGLGLIFGWAIRTLFLNRRK